MTLVGVCFSILVVMAILSSCSEIAMRVRLTNRASSGDKLVWWRRGGDDVADAYEEIFPHTRLPLLRRLAFWLVLAFASAILILILWKSH